MSLRDDFLTEIEAFIRAHGLTATGFGKQCLNDQTFVFELRKPKDQGGRDPKADTVDRVRAWMREYQPPARPTQRHVGASAAA